jgi:hypothetical protein
MSWLFSLKKDKPKVNQKSIAEDVVQLLEEIEQAKKQWIQSQIFFDWAVDPETIDYAIHYMEFAEKRYMYLLKQAKKIGAIAKPTG